MKGVRKCVSIVEISTSGKQTVGKMRRSNTDPKLCSLEELTKLLEGDLGPRDLALELKTRFGLTDNAVVVGGVDSDAVCGVSEEGNHSFYQSSSLKVEMYGNMKRYTEHVETNIQIQRPNSSNHRYFRQMSAPVLRKNNQGITLDFGNFSDFHPFSEEQTIDDGGLTNSITFDAYLFQTYEDAEEKVNFSVSEIPHSYGRLPHLTDCVEGESVETRGMFPLRQRSRSQDDSLIGLARSRSNFN